MRAIKERKPVLEFTYRILRLDGGVRRLEARTYLPTDESGAPALMTGHCNDVAFDEHPDRLRNVSLQLRCRELVRRSREALGLLVEGNPYGGLLMRRGDTILFANDAFARLVGLDEGSALAGRNCWRRSSRACFANGSQHKSPARLRLVRRDGTQVDASVSESGQRQFDGGVAVVAVVRQFEEGAAEVATIEEKASRITARRGRSNGSRENQ